MIVSGKHKTFIAAILLAAMSSMILFGCQTASAGAEAKSGKVYQYVYPDYDRLDSLGTGTRAPIKNRSKMFEDAYEALLDVRNAVKSGRLDDGRKILDELWSKYPRGNKVWNRLIGDVKRNSPVDGTDFGKLPFYVSLIFYDDIINWRIKNKIFKRKSDKKIDLLIILVNEHHLTVRADDKAPVTTVSKTDPALRKDDYLPIREAFSDFDEIVFYVTEGEYSLRLNIVEEPGPTTSSIEYNTSTNSSLRCYPDQRNKFKQTYGNKLKADWMFLLYPINKELYAKITKEAGRLVPGGMGGYQGRPYLYGSTEKMLYSRNGQRKLMSSDERIGWLTLWLIHEYMHRFYGLSKDLNLEPVSHSYYNKSTWPKDFEGFHHFDYYTESFKKRIHLPGRKRIHEKLVRPEGK